MSFTPNGRIRLNVTGARGSLTADATAIRDQAAGYATAAQTSATSAQGSATSANNAKNSILNNAGFMAISADLTGPNTIGTVAGISQAVVTAANSSAAINGVYSDLSLGSTSKIAIVASNIANINTVAARSNDVSIVASRIDAIVAAPGYLNTALGYRDDTRAARDQAYTARDTAVSAAGQAAGAVSGNQPLKFLADVAPTAPLTALTGLQTIDGVPGAAGLRVLNWNDPIKKRRGLWVMATGAWARAADMNTFDEVGGAVVIVKGGTINFMTEFVFINNIVTLSVDGSATGDDILIEKRATGAQALHAVARQAYGVIVKVGDSNTAGRTGTSMAYLRGRGHPRVGAWKNWPSYIMADSGFKLDALVKSIPTGDRNPTLPPVGHYLPAEAPGFSAPVSSGGGGGNVWLVVKAANLNPNSLIEIDLGINDFGLGRSSRVPGASGDPAVYRQNMKDLLALLLVTTNAQIVIKLPQPFEGKDFVQGINVTEWASDSPDGTVAGGAAARNAEMFGVLREFNNRNPRVHVFDAPRLVYGADVCPDKTTSCLDLQIPATYNGVAVPAELRRQIDDTLHRSNLGARRTEEQLQGFYGLPTGSRASVGDYQTWANRIDSFSIVDGESFYFENLNNQGPDTAVIVRASVENRFWKGNQYQALLGSSGTTPTHQALTLAEVALMMKRPGPVKRILGFRGEIKCFFPASGNTYTVNDIVFSSVTTDTDVFSSKYYNLTFKGANMGAEMADAQGADLGYPGSVQPDTSAQEIFVYVTRLDDTGYHRKTVDIPIIGQYGTSLPNFDDGAGDNIWLARKFFASRIDNNPVTLTITLSLQNIGDGRFVDGSINFGTGEGMPIGTFTFDNGNQVGTWNPNTANINAAIAAGIGWDGVAGSNWVTMKPGYRFRARASDTNSGSPVTLTNPAQVWISN